MREPWTRCKHHLRQRLGQRQRRWGSRRNLRRFVDTLASLFVCLFFCTLASLSVCWFAELSDFIHLKCRTSMSLKLLWTIPTRPMPKHTRPSSVTRTSTGGQIFLMSHNIELKLAYQSFISQRGGGSIWTRGKAAPRGKFCTQMMEILSRPSRFHICQISYLSFWICHETQIQIQNHENKSQLNRAIK